MARKQVSRKRRVKKNIENGVAHIRSTLTDTCVTITSDFGNAFCELVISWCISTKDLKNQHRFAAKWLVKVHIK